MYDKVICIRCKFLGDYNNPIHFPFLASARHIDIAFKMFDLNGDGEVTLDEFKKVGALYIIPYKTEIYRTKGTLSTKTEEDSTM